MASKKKKPAPQKPAAPVTPTPDKPKGRPAGSANVTEIVTVAPSRCQKCGSTERTAYTNVTEREIGGLTNDGKLYTHILWRSTRCAGCGQARRDRSYENRTGGK